MSTQKERNLIALKVAEIAKTLQKCRDSHEGHPAVLALIRVLEETLVNVPITTCSYNLINHNISGFDQLHDMLKTARTKLTKKLGKIGFRLTNQTRISAFMTLEDPESDYSYQSYHSYQEYATVECKFVFARKYEVLELVTQFKSGYTYESDTFGYSGTTWWVTDKLELDPHDDNYSLNKAIITHKGFSIDILEVASDVSDLFRSRWS